jgi:arylsulfatase
MKQRRQVDPQANRPLDPAKRQTLKKLASLGMLAVGADLSLSGLSAFGDPVSRSVPESASALREAVADANVVICVLDAARAHHFGCYGYPRETTQNTDRLARQSRVFDSHFCQHTVTAGSVACLFTGQYPDTHLAYKHRPVGASTFTIARGLGEAGFLTALFSSNPWACPQTGKGLDFQVAHSPDDAAGVAKADEAPEHTPEPLLRLFSQWLDENKRSRFLCYLHFMPPHGPYGHRRSYGQQEALLELFRGQTPPGYRPERHRPGKWDFPLNREVWRRPLPMPQWMNLYDSNLRYGDWAAGEVRRLLRKAGVWDNTIFILTSDHGEAFGEHGFVFHNTSPYDEVARIPLLVRLPRGIGAGRTGALTQSIDILPTLCDLLGIHHPKDGIQGQSLLPLMAGARDRVHEYVFTHSFMDRDKYMVRGLDHSLLLYGRDGWRAFYDLNSDPDQERNVIGNHPAKVAELIEAFRRFAQDQRWDIMHCLDPTARYAARPLGDPGEALSPTTRRQLKSLGYL